jgi:D-alanyl-D-alanine carboxypeptidase/D-alanyl-D-alanine-endopeptidase (penicillin-binding protein 4)
MKKHYIAGFVLFCFLCVGNTGYLFAGKLEDIQKLIGKQDAILVADAGGTILLSKNADKPLIPASILKVLTSLAGLHYLGEEFKFATEFYTDAHSNLKIKGYGDPLLISEAVAEIAKSLRTKIDIYNDLILDNSYFEPIIIPGVTTTLNPYDAPNGALCVNFNTVFFKREKGGYVSAEPQTPLLPFALKKIKAYGMKKERVTFSQEQDEITLYAGHLFQYFLEQEGIQSKGGIKIGKANKEKDTLIYQYVSRFSIEDVIAKLLEHSNNFIANQLFVTVGAKVYGPPGTLKKGIRAVSAYAKDVLKLENVEIDEGSGISRQNRISAGNMYKVLEVFEPRRGLMRHEGREFYKTGSLTGVKTRAGYIESEKNGLYRFVVMLNSGKSTNRIMSRLLHALP